MNSRLSKMLLASGLALSSGLGLLQFGPLAQAADAPTASDPLLLARGAQTWANNCARCHNMRNPNELRDDQWRAVVAHMRVRGGLTGQEAREVLAFLQGSN